MTEENNKDFEENNDSNDHHDVSHSDIGQSLPIENTTPGSTIAKRVAKVLRKRMPKRFGEFVATINKRITEKKEGTSNVPIIELSSEVHEASASSQMGLCVETKTVKRDGIYFVCTTSQVILERSRDYWGFDVLTLDDRNVIDAFLQLPIAKNATLWSTLEFELLVLDLHELLFGKHLIDRTIHAWLVCMKQRSNITIWQGKEVTWDFILPFGLSDSFDQQKLDFISSRCPGKGLQTLAKVEIIFVPLNLSNSWHWHLLVIDYVERKFKFYDSMSGKFQSLTPINANERLKSQMAHFIAKSFEVQLVMSCGDDFEDVFVCDCPQQPADSVACGVYACVFADVLVKGESLDSQTYDWFQSQRAVMCADILKKSSYLN